MDADKPEELLLGKVVEQPLQYAPEVLQPIPRSLGRKGLTLPDTGLAGADLWHAYELSWLDPGGKPVARVGRLTVPAASPNIVESKSLKLYLNSLNGEPFDNADQLRGRVETDVSAAAGLPVSLELCAVDDASLAGTPLRGTCIDALDARAPASAPDANLLQCDPGQHGDEQLYSHLMRSLCPVTGQPDWATVWLSYRGPALRHESVLAYLLSFREHQEFHEQCVERIFCDLLAIAQPEYLQVQAFYTRRGGLDINPMRSTDPADQPLPRLNRQ